MNSAVGNLILEIFNGIAELRKQGYREQISSLEKVVESLKEELARVKFVERRRLEQCAAASIRAKYEKEGY